MIILGIDPGSRKAGFGLLNVQGRKVSYIHSDTIHFDIKKEFNERVPEFFNSVKEIVSRFHPEHVVLESLIYVKSPTALIKLAQARGAMLAALHQCGYAGKLFEYSPNLIKSQTTGHGHSDKLAGQKFLDTILGPREYKTDDESDALLIAMCHAFQHNNPINTRSTRSGSLAQSVAHKI
ncbi:MAG: crossover junction endodeoxyribonuclease RuvC [Halobacteriovoraceae bacterium]|nr:crossover junction endodeoxyribonuclease RuvC [Halobacteriovoraceae bacterium]